MKNVAMLLTAAALTMGAGAFHNGEKKLTEAYINIPEEKAVHILEALVTFLDYGVVKIETA